MAKGMGYWWVPAGSFVLALLLGALASPLPSAEAARRPRQETQKHEDTFTVKVEGVDGVVDTLDDNGLARGFAKVKPVSSGVTVTSFTNFKITLILKAGGGSRTTDDITDFTTRTSGLGTDSAAFRLDITSTWRNIVGNALAETVEASWTIEATANFSDGTSIPRSATGRIRVK